MGHYYPFRTDYDNLVKLQLRFGMDKSYYTQHNSFM